MRKSTHSNGSHDLHLSVANQILDLLSSQELTWDKPWVSISGDGKEAHDALSGRIYSGLNQILLSIKQIQLGNRYNGWLTFKQVQGMRGRVISGEHASAIYFYEVVYFDKSGKRYRSEQPQAMSEAERRRKELIRRFILRSYNVFNIAQTVDLPPLYYEVREQPVLTTMEKDDRAEGLINSAGAKIIHWISDEVCYNYVNDMIFLPLREQFKGTVEYYETVLHELAHWTGHASRLNRKLRNVFGSEGYAKEELIAELCSAFLCADLGFSMNITNNAAYIQSWIDVLKEDPRNIFNAIHVAENAAKFITSFTDQAIQIDKTEQERNL